MNKLKFLLRLKPYLIANNSPRWLVIFFDICISLIAIFLAYLLRFNFQIPTYYSKTLFFIIPLVLLIRVLFFISLRVHLSIVRYTGMLDIKRIIASALSGSLVFLGFNVVNYQLHNAHFLIPFSVILIDFILVVYLMTNLRLLVRHLFFVYNYSLKLVNIMSLVF